MKELNSQITQKKLRNKFLNAGVNMSGPETIFFSNDTRIGKNVTY
jgi:bifunctional UDP-N-acetylglucosamine pyrophosphorylase/glucosamine-1-phosphate N-acetyltransferase